MRPKTVLSFGLGGLLLFGFMSMDWRLWQRAATYPATPITRTDWYAPLAPVPGGGGTALPRRSPTGTHFTAALDQVRDYAAERNSTALLVIHEGDVVLEEYWQGYTPETISNGMSMTKTLVGLLIGIAIEEGHIGSVQDEVGDYLPEWRRDLRGKLTLEHLLYMHSGLRNDDRINTPFSDLVKMYMGSRVNDTALRVPIVRAAQQRYEYNNVNTQILSLILARATGENFVDYLSSRLWQPVAAADGAIWLDRPGGEAKTFCCFFATAEDWGRVGLMMLNQGETAQGSVVPAPWLEKMQQPSPIEDTFGYHLWIKARTPDYPTVDRAASRPFAVNTWYLDGRHLQRVYGVPEEDLVIVRLGEQPPTWDDEVMPNLLVDGLRQDR
jgi:CubicO group peptidase (beta-lactamase class C family)